MKLDYLYVWNLLQVKVVLRQLPDSGVLLSKESTQIIVPLGKLMVLGYSVNWNSDGFVLTSPSGEVVETTLEGKCPMVSEGCASLLLDELE